jgi:hypothetical protein
MNVTTVAEFEASELLPHLPFRAHRVKGLQQKCAKRPVRRDRTDVTPAAPRRQVPRLVAADDPLQPGLQTVRPASPRRTGYCGLQASSTAFLKRYPDLPAERHGGRPHSACAVEAVPSLLPLLARPRVARLGSKVSLDRAPTQPSGISGNERAIR